MTRAIWFGCAALLSTLGARSVAAAPDERWIHVRVEEKSDGGETVHVNVPLSMAEAVLPLVNEEGFSGGKVKISGTELTADQLRALRAAVQKAPDGEYVTVESPKEHVRVAKTGEILTVEVTDSAGSNEAVHVKMPMRVVDALLSSGGSELDVLAAVRSLGEQPDGELVAVNDATSTVRVWVDQRPAGK